MYRIFSILFILTIGSMSLFAQTDRIHIRKGNSLYRSGGIEQAEVEYSKAVTKNDRNPQALYNLACAYMQQNKDSLALVVFLCQSVSLIYMLELNLAAACNLETLLCT